MTTTIARSHARHVHVTAAGWIDAEWWCLDGALDDPSDGRPALIGYRADGSISIESHYHHGELDDAFDGRPAVVRYDPDGGVVAVERFHRNRRISGESQSCQGRPLR